MLNEDRIKLMTEIAIYEKKENRGALHINHFFRRDYIGGKMMKAAVDITLSFMIFAGLWAVYNAEELLMTVEIERFLQLGRSFALCYVAALLVYLAIAYGVYSLRYHDMKRSIKGYQTRLKRLEKRYEFQAKASEMTRGDA